MPLSTFLILISAVLALLGALVGWSAGAPGDDSGARGLVWSSWVSLGLLVVPGILTWRLQRLTRNMAIFATIAALVVLAALTWTGTPGGGTHRVAWVLLVVAAFGLLAGGILGWRDPPYAE